MGGAGWGCQFFQLYRFFHRFDVLSWLVVFTVALIRMLLLRLGAIGLLVNNVLHVCVGTTEQTELLVNVVSH